MRITGRDLRSGTESRTLPPDQDQSTLQQHRDRAPGVTSNLSEARRDPYRRKKEQNATESLSESKPDAFNRIIKIILMILRQAFQNITTSQEDL